MGSFCGWSGRGLSSDMSQRAITTMLKSSGGTTPGQSESDYDEAGALGVREGLYATHYLNQDGIRAAIVGSPTWDDRELVECAKKHGAAAALIKAYRDFGKDLLSQLHGSFSLAILDGDKALVAVDRIGIRSLTYALREGVFVFSTSTASVVRHPRVNQRIDPQAIFNYLYFHDIPSPGTIYEGVEKLLPAQYVQFRNGQLEKGYYWQLHYDS